MTADKASFNPWVLLLYLILTGLLVFLALMPASQHAEIKDAIFGPKPLQPKGPWHFMCDAPDCGHSLTIETAEGYQNLVGDRLKRLREQDSFEPLILPCPQCGNDAFFPAELCPNCQKIFIPKMHKTPYAEEANDACPDCQWSPSEERMRQWRKKQNERKAR